MFLKEIKRGIFNKRFLVLSLISLVLFLISSYDTVWRDAFGIDRVGDLNSEGMKYLLEYSRNKYHIWIQSYRFISIIFPFVIVIPYTYSYVNERKNKFNLLVISRCGRIKYLINKFIAISCTGALALALPEIIYYIGLSIFSRNTILKPFQLYPYGFFSELFTYSPDSYILMTILMHLVLGFTFGAFALGIASFCINKTSVYLIPFGVCLILNIIISNIDELQNYSILDSYLFMFRENYSLINFIITNMFNLSLGVLLFSLSEKRRFLNG